MNMVSKLAAGVALSALMATGAMASDIFAGDKSLKDDANYASGPTVNWTGFYIGGAVGYGNANHDLSVQEYTKDFCATDVQRDAAAQLFGEGGSPSLNHVLGDCDGKDDQSGVKHFSGLTRDTGEKLDGLNSSGLVGDVRAGFDYANGRFLVGVFGSYGFNNMEANGSPGDLASFSLEKQNEWSLGARAGLIVAPRTLAYILAAYTQTDYELSGVLGSGAGAKSFSKETTFDGVTVGGGIEFALGSNVFLGVEGTHTFYGEETIFDVAPGVVGAQGTRINDDLDETKVMGTLKIKLNGGLGN